MAKIQAYVSDEVAEKINAIVEKRKAEGAGRKMLVFPVCLRCLSS